MMNEALAAMSNEQLMNLAARGIEPLYEYGGLVVFLLIALGVETLFILFLTKIIVTALKENTVALTALKTLIEGKQV